MLSSRWPADMLMTPFARTSGGSSLYASQGVTLAGTVRVESDGYGDDKAACDGGEMVEEVFARVWVRDVSEHRAWPGSRRGCEPV